MAVTHPTAFRDTVADLVDSTLGTTAKLVFRLTGTAGSPGTAVATLSFGNPAFGASSSGTITANSITSDTNATGNGTTSTHANTRRNTSGASRCAAYGTADYPSNTAQNGAIARKVIAYASACSVTVSTNVCKVARHLNANVGIVKTVGVASQRPAL